MENQIGKKLEKSMEMKLKLGVYGGLKKDSGRITSTKNGEPN